MTDNEIIKALECCYDGWNCKSCAFDDGDESMSICTSKLAKAALDLIKRQQTEIQALKKKADAYDSYPMKVLVGHNSEVFSKTWEDYVDFISDVAAEGVKEFADKIVGQLEAEKYRGMESLEPIKIAFNFGINKALDIVKGEEI